MTAVAIPTTPSDLQPESIPVGILNDGGQREGVSAVRGIAIGLALSVPIWLGVAGIVISTVATQ